MKFFLALPFLFAVANATATKKCPLRPVDETAAISLDLPISVLSHGLKDLPIEFHGVHPMVVRKPIAFGKMPKITVQRYSGNQPPVIEFDEEKELVTIKNSVCSAGGSSGGSSSNAPSCHSRPSTLFSTLMMAGSAVAALNDNTRPTAALLASAAAPGFMGAVQAHEDECTPVVQVVVEAPAAYRGVLETCLDEVNDPAICPNPFPTFPTCDDTEPSCKIAVVGAGTGGLYTALRMVDEGMVEASDVCIFEMTERVGGRLLSLRGLGPDDDLTVDVGGYRTWPRFTPTAHALITEYLGIPMDCYDDSDPCEVYNIVDDDGRKAGFATFAEVMMERLTDNGACFYPYHELVAIEKRAATAAELEVAIQRQFVPPIASENMVTDLMFANGVTATATWTTILNIPQRPLLNVVRNSNFDAKDMLDSNTLDALHSVQPVVAQKLYLYYPRGHVWWRKLGIISGDFEWEGDARNMLLAGRYHDGPVYCDDEDDPDTCHGFLLAVYTNDLSGNKAQFFSRYQREREEPVTIFTNNDLEGAELLRHAHRRLEDFHKLYNTNGNYTGFAATQAFNGVEPPPYAYLSTWNNAIPWAGGAWHAWTELSNIDTAKQPFVDHNLFFVNEAYSLLQGWAEGAVKLADEILEDHFGIARPWDFPVVDINQLVRQTNSEECVEGAPSTESSGGGGGSGSSGGAGSSSGTAEDAILCFHGDSLIEMADGSLKKIREVKTGDFVATGTDGRGTGAGLVTEALKHSVEKEVPVAVVSTPLGDLVGTPDHPILSKKSGEWMEMRELKVELGVYIETRYIDAFYNLEIDGNILDEQRASHSYVVNGIMASGLGDHKELNRRFPRQKHFQLKDKRHLVEINSLGYEAMMFKARNG
ncbi:Hint-domain containing protein [Nitzschia inconspicua]|uniref:Hint-domain containing protein n=1 Tax=Nitzschia inconspicua TaxID=303405 RepID=A0A9K3M4R2_9STRA|nr:Hint-domain containing protein [Nitzschia inconspicua]